MRAQQPIRRGAALATRACIAGATAVAAHAAPAAAAPVPAPCGGVAQIADAAGDGHHNNTDVTAAWLSEASGRLQAVIQPRAAVWEPAHDDSDAAGFALLFEAGGVTRYVRAEAPRGGPVGFDQGTWTRAGGFASAGSTAGEAVAGSGGAVTIDVPAVAPGTVLSRLFVLTYDGGTGADQHWVDRAPGGVTPDGSEFGADFVAGACAPGGPGTAPGPGGAMTTTAVALDARRRVVGGGRTEISGRVTPARAGVSVDVTAGARRTVVRRATTQSDGSFSLLLAIGETTRVRAVAEGIASQTRTVSVLSKVRIKVRDRAAGGAVVTGSVRPRLPGRVLLLRRGAVKPTATAKPRDGRFRIRLDNPRRGRYQAVYIPTGDRAERSTSNTGVIR